MAIDRKGLYISGVSMTHTSLSGPAAAAVGLAALGVVVTDMGWQVVRHGTVMAHDLTDGKIINHHSMSPDDRTMFLVKTETAVMERIGGTGGN